MLIGRHPSTQSPDHSDHSDRSPRFIQSPLDYDTIRQLHHNDKPHNTIAKSSQIKHKQRIYTIVVIAHRIAIELCFRFGFQLNRPRSSNVSCVFFLFFINLENNYISMIV